ncbi:glycosyltransferase family 2 protein [Microbacterium allomyrinae]|jgi:N-acetylglucosaminyl-diphospho-decaprenol L-rhamnosyltransferase|uniref:Glycosyltransferase family 2 protein n=1 Tax=Microbacterium allomyrinae TaxID=2830666 RepID=A0A9X1LZA5_9MICO|nr:glycosyltransferase family 2 protein [Microbacterium allomyrinae]MCC2034025.1 glycosyltransferase family 2 protein [Microbacterium allomyrinae]
MNALPSVAIVIVNYNTRDETVTAVRRVRENTRIPLEIVVVDNGSHDGSADALRAAFDDVTVVEAGGNIGFAAGVNLGVRNTTASAIVLLNPDTEALPGAIDAIVGFARARPEFGLYGGRTLRPDGTTDPSSCWGEMTLWSLFAFATGLSTLFKSSAVFDPESLGRWQRDTVREVPIITGCLLLTARESWEALGGMDERFFLYGEDADFSRRAREMGLRPVIVPDATIVHAVGGSTSSSGLKMSMVMAGKATVLHTSWSPMRRRLGIALLQAGALLRSRSATWATVWRRRRDWRDGYPRARAALFPSDQASGPTASEPMGAPIRTVATATRSEE